LRNDVRSFALDGIRKAKLLEERAKNVAEGDLDEALSSGYGIFTGRKTEWATLRFSPDAARWVAYEKWHSRQKTREESDGSFVLEIPYSDDRELVMDVMRHGANVEVLGPRALREKVAAAHAAAAKRYR
jgi:predicted DNA-binding transcriptional regulator YafY